MKIMLKVEKIDESYEFKIGETIIVSILHRPDIRGKFIEWQEKPEAYSGRYLVLEQTYENYVLGLAYLLDTKLIDREEFKSQIEIEEYNKHKNRKLADNSIYRINNKYYHSSV